MAILNRLTQRRGFGENDFDADGETSGLTEDLARRYRDRLISELPEQELERLVAMPARMRESKIAGWVTDMMREEGQLLPTKTLSEVIDIVQYEMVGLGPLQPLLRDPSITEIMVNWVKQGPEDRHGRSQVYVERAGELEPAPEIRFENQAHLRHIIDRIISPLGRRVDESSPRVDARLPEGHRVNAIIPPLAVDGPILTIRRFRQLPFTDKDLIEKYDTLTAEMMTFLRACVKAKLNILISGGTGSGKTTTLNVMASFIPHRERIITIEDAAELRFYNTHPHVARLETRPPNVEGEGEVTIRELVRNALRMRPDRIIVGEVRGGEALDMLQAMNTGHEGSMTTIHANSTRDAFSRLENMVMMAESARQLPLHPIREQMASAIDIVVQQDRIAGGQRKVVSISEVMGVRKGQIFLKDIFLFQQTGLNEHNKAQGYFSPTGVIPVCLPRLREALPDKEYKELEGIFSLDYFFRELSAGLMQDKSVSEIMINGADEIYVEQRGRLRKLSPEELQQAGGIGIRHAKHLEHIVETIAARLGRRVDQQQPMVDVRLPDGSRVNAVLPPLSLKRNTRAGEEGSPVITIRRFPEPFLANDLLARAALSQNMVAFLEACIRSRLNVLISGGTGSGKTTLLNVLSAFVPVEQRIITIEDVAELQLKQPHWVRLETRPADEYGEGEVTIRDLVRNSLRMRPDRIIVGEVRGGEALDMLQAMNTGHEGSLTTLHSNSPRDAFSRLETMVRMAPEARELTVRELRQLLTVLDLVVQVARLPDGSRKITSITEVQEVTEQQLILQEVYRFEQEGISSDGQAVLGHFRPTGYESRHLPRLRAYGFQLPAGAFDPTHLEQVHGERFTSA